MIRVAVLYPNSDGSSFDLDYYRNTHMVLVWNRLRPYGLIGCEVDGAVQSAGREPQPYAAIGYMFFETVAAFDEAFSKAGDELVADIPNYTNIEPVIQISDYQRIELA